MRLYPIKTPEIVQRMFPDFLWCFSSSNKEIYLTFDDGPTPTVTEFVLDQLRAYNAKATFFCVGKNIELHPSLFSKIVKEGHSIGNHTYNHLKGWKTLRADYLKDTLHAQKVIENSTLNTQNSKLFRPPYGKIKTMQTRDLQKEGFKIVMWDVLSADWDSTETEKNCLKNVIENVKKGSIVVFHDSQKAEKKLHFVLPKVLAHFKEKGFEFKAIN